LFKEKEVGMVDNNIFPVPKEAKESFRQFAEQTTGWKVKDTNIKKIVVSKFSNASKKDVVVDISVETISNSNLFDTSSEPILAIFESNTYLVVTPNRGGLRGAPYLFGHDQVISVERG
jgi:hypothetical protein